MIITNFEQLRPFLKVPGNYKFRNKSNNWHYCGETNNLFRRIVYEHANALGKHYIDYFIGGHGLLESFEIELIDWGNHLKEKIIRIALETACIDFYDCLVENGHGYNLCLFGNDRTKVKNSKEHIRKTIEGIKKFYENNDGPMKNKHHSQETINKLKGQKRSPEQIKNISDAQKELYENGYVNPRKGKTNSKEHCKKISITSKQNNSHKGKNNSQFNHTIYKFKNRITNEIFEGTQYDFYTKNNISPSDVCAVLKNKQKSVKNWILIPNTNQS